MPHSVASDMGLHCLPITLGLNVFYFIEITTQSYIHTILIRIRTKTYCLFSSSPKLFNPLKTE